MCRILYGGGVLGLRVHVTRDSSPCQSGAAANEDAKCAILVSDQQYSKLGIDFRVLRRIEPWGLSRVLRHTWLYCSLCCDFGATRVESSDGLSQKRPLISREHLTLRGTRLIVECSNTEGVLGAAEVTNYQPSSDTGEASIARNEGQGIAS